jgi:hypothetical protein
MFSASNLKLSLLVLLITPALASASSPKQCVNYAFLKNGFNMQAYQVCDAQLKKCPNEHGMIPAEACVKKVIETTPDCQQLNKLSQKVHGTLGLLTAAAAGKKFVIITQHYPADGQHSYYIISPLGYIVTTNIDPRSIDADLKKRYSTADFYTKTSGDIETGTASNGSMHFTVPLQVTKTCSACEVIGLAKVQFNFSSKGKPNKAKLVSFEVGSGETATK